MGVVATALALLAFAPAVSAQVLMAGVDPGPIPSPNAAGLPTETGAAVADDPFAFRAPPRHPLMAPNGQSNIHVDAYQSDTNTIGGPLGPGSTDSAYFIHECASITFDSKGRIVSVCVGLDRPVLTMLDPKTLIPMATLDLPPRPPGGSFTDFSGGGYFYLDQRDRVVTATSERHILIIGETDAPGFETVRDFDISGELAADDKIISTLPDWKGRIWFASTEGTVGWVDRKTGEVHKKVLAEHIGNSFAVDEKGSVYMVTDAALYRLEARHVKVKVLWRRGYRNDGVQKPGQTQAGSGTTPTLMAGGRLVAITDNADPMHVLAFRRAIHPNSKRLVCRRRLFEKGASSTDQSLIGAGRALIAENNYGYTVAGVQAGGVTQPGIQRVDVNKKLTACRTVWRSNVRAPSVVPKVSAKSGLLYTYTKPPAGTKDPWYLTALDFDTGKTKWKRLAGEGLGFNNNYAPITLGPGRKIYLGVLGGIVKFTG
ncbi:hypothetical protein BH10ACT11_BH10ACT11_17280 [soil metagenome]